jgi:alpha-ketoglutarate-dependent taurine dioxygenase
MLPSLGVAGEFPFLTEGLSESHFLFSNIRAHNHFGAEFHGDHSYEVNPPSYTLLRLLKTPPSGGDTIWTSQTALFEKLSPTFQKTFEGLHGIHSSDVSIHSAVSVATNKRVCLLFPYRDHT